jgi:hypothetical protein
LCLQIINRDALDRLYSRPAYRDEAKNQPILVHELIPHLEYITKSMVASSILWVRLRTVEEPSWDDQSDEVFKSTFEKEFRAACLEIFAVSPQLPYTYFDPRSLKIPHHLRPPWSQRALDIAPYIVNRLARRGNLIPRVNRTKNVSRPTAEEYLLYRDDRTAPEVRTVDLEILYGQTGVKIGGPCEMRKSWGFGDLKPRLYYCKGGLAHHASKYMKDITVTIMDALDITHVDNRRRPWEFLEGEEFEHIVYWDLTAFTSTLSELKHYLYYLSCAIEDYGARPLFAVDYHLGLVEMSLPEVIRSYSEVVNILHPITVTRLLDRFVHDVEDLEYDMVNSGPLGVDGNIGLSTACHGYAMLLESEGPRKDVNVGDDGLSLRAEHPKHGLFPRIRTIGHMHDEKEGIIPAFDWTTVGKFLKRRLERVDGGIWIGELLSLPIPNLVDGNYGFRTPPTDSDTRRIFKIMKTCGSVMWSITGDCRNMSHRDYHLVSIYLQELYRRIGADVRGSLEGFTPHKSACFSDDSPGFIRVAYPPVVFDSEFDPWYGDWLLYLLHRDAAIAHVVINTLTCQARIEKPYQGDLVYTARDPHYGVLEDLGYIVTEEIKRSLDLTIEGDRESFLDHVLCRKKDLVPMISISVVEPIPSKFDFMFVTPSRIGADTFGMY